MIISKLPNGAIFCGLPSSPGGGAYNSKSSSDLDDGLSSFSNSKTASSQNEASSVFIFSSVEKLPNSFSDSEKKIDEAEIFNNDVKEINKTADIIFNFICLFLFLH